jgi:MerR family transcriptional regulator, thiopeptide resistance regulator
MSLKKLDFSLEEVKELFESPEYNPKEVIEMQLERLNKEIKLKEELRQQLQVRWEVFHSWKRPNVEQFISSIELIKNQKEYFTRAQIDFFTGADAGIIHSAERYYTDNPHKAKRSGMSGELYKYIKDVLSNIK